VALVVPAVVAAIAVVFWYGIELVSRRGKRVSRMERVDEKTDIKDKIRHEPNPIPAEAFAEFFADITSGTPVPPEAAPPPS
jgi:hypothetical protein